MAPSHDPMEEIKASFFVECEELLEALQDALTTLDEGAQDDETINIIFRAVHSIKGGAGAFGLAQLVAFAHRFETVLDAVRSKRMEASSEAIKQFFLAADLLQDHVRAAQSESAPPEGADAVLEALETLMGGVPEEATEEVIEFQPMGLSFDFDLGGDEPAPIDIDANHLSVTFRPKSELYTSGNEPYQLLRALKGLGATNISCDTTRLPFLEELEPETSYLAWSAKLPAEVPEASVREAFEFVEDICEVEITLAVPDPSQGLPEEPTPALSEIAELPPLAAPEAAPAPTHAPASSAPQPIKAPAPTPASTTINEISATVRVDIDRIDRLVNLVGELVINQAMLAESVAQAGLPANSTVMIALDAFTTLTRDLQDSVMMIRAQPIKPLFQRMARIVREASGEVHKEVRLKTDGEATEIDKTVIERLADPLTHMIRNAVDHGLELPQERLAAGKPAEGLISLSAQHRAGRVVIEIKDDGAGINRPKVRRIAEEKGLIPVDAHLSDADIDALLFLPGFSTATEISALSGRGVGMDVVKSAITSLGGRVTIASERGVGTTLSISLPLTLAVLDGMIVQVAGQTLVVPLASIVETAALTGDEIRSFGNETSVMHIRDGFAPLYDLGAELGYRSPKASYAGSIVLLSTQEGGATSALIVDTILEQRQVVIKGLAQAYGHIPGIAAATILGDGQIALIVDPHELIHNASGRTRAPISPPLALAG